MSKFVPPSSKPLWTRALMDKIRGFPRGHVVDTVVVSTVAYGEQILVCIHRIQLNFSYLDPTMKTASEALPAKSLQSCPTLCNPMDCSLPGFSIHGILHTRTLEWVAISFSIGSTKTSHLQTWRVHLALNWKQTIPGKGN